MDRSLGTRVISGSAGEGVATQDPGRALRTSGHEARRPSTRPSAGEKYSNRYSNALRTAANRTGPRRMSDWL
jgi:hypothetical protein